LKYKAVIYDCDGVLFDSFDANFAFYNRIMEMMGCSPLDRGDSELMRVLHTFSSREVFAYMFPPGPELERAVSCMSAVDYTELVPLMIPERDMVETLELLLGKVHLGICTNRSTSMGTVLDSFGLRHFFGCVMTASGGVRPKPHPDPLLRVLDHFGIAPHEALFIGDSEVDRMAAAAAAVPFAVYRQDLPALARLESHADVLALL
jgi:phosphoglycolate phosphatase